MGMHTHLYSGGQEGVSMLQCQDIVLVGMDVDVVVVHDQ